MNLAMPYMRPVGANVGWRMGRPASALGRRVRSAHHGNGGNVQLKQELPYPAPAAAGSGVGLCYVVGS